MSRPRITFGIIVLNGEPFTRYNLRMLYPFAHQIIVVEGANPHSKHTATPDGHSLDGTLEVLRQFKAKEDPENKVVVVTREGFWEEKDEQSQAYAKLATGDYLWQVDIDEFYRPEDIECILRMLDDNPSITGMSFNFINFWGGFDYVVTSGRQWSRNHPGNRRIFKWAPGSSYTTHRPPTVIDANGQDMMKINHIDRYATARMGIFIYHYYAVFPQQVIRKAYYYKSIGWKLTRDMDRWVEERWLHLRHPFRVFHAFGNFSWLDSFEGIHPPEILKLRQDIATGNILVEIRETGDIETLLASRWYRLGKVLVQIIERLRGTWGFSVLLSWSYWAYRTFIRNNAFLSRAFRLGSR